jgi:hypothetical protein
MNLAFVFCHNWGGERIIAQLLPDGSWLAVPKQQLQLSLENRRVQLPPDGQNKERSMPLADFWTKHPKRREVGQVVFDPEDKLPAHGRRLNLWGGFAVQPTAGDCSLITSHIYNVICSRDNVTYNYLLSWLAHAAQRPGTAPETVPVLRADPGSYDSR